MRQFEKPPLSVPEQLLLLKRRGLAIEDDNRAQSFLETVSFFRLSPYMRPFQRTDDIDHGFSPGAQMSSLTRLYDFDRRLRLLLMDALERIEVATRAAISNHMGPQYGSHWYLDPQVFRHDFRHQALLDSLVRKQEIARRDYDHECLRIDRSNAPEGRKQLLKSLRRKESYARHYALTYREPALMPGWAALEEITLGELSHLYKGLARDVDKKTIARAWGLPAPLLQSWLHTLTTIRNLCAHHARVWNRELGIRPELPRAAQFPWPEDLQQPGAHARVYTILCILTLLMRRLNPHAHWDAQVITLVSDFREASLTAMGFADNWQHDPFWRTDGC